MRIGVDIGGTFTDLACIDDAGALHTAKTPSTPDDPSRGVMDGLALLADSMGRDMAGLLGATSLFLHGSTVATNLVVERKGACVALVTTAGIHCRDEEAFALADATFRVIPGDVAIADLGVSIDFDNSGDPNATLVSIEGNDQSGLLVSVTAS